MEKKSFGGLAADFWAKRPLIGMVHLKALPGSPWHREETLDHIVQSAVIDARALAEGGANAVMVENFFDAPFAKDSVPPHTVAAMTYAALSIRKAITVPLGINVLRNDVKSALAIAHSVGGNFVRANIYVGAAVTDQGIIEGAAREAILYRRHLDANVAIWADIHVKHASQLGSTSLADAARDAVERGHADALIVSGVATGQPTDLEDVFVVRKATPNTPLLIGSGFTSSSANSLLAAADGAIVGASLKLGGRIDAPIDIDRVRELRIAMNASISRQ